MRASTRSRSGSRRWRAPRRATPAASPPVSSRSAPSNAHQTWMRPSPGSSGVRDASLLCKGYRMRKLTTADIKDLREYERERDAFRSEIIVMKKRRRIKVGDLMSFVFENADTMRFQIQE